MIRESFERERGHHWVQFLELHDRLLDRAFDLRALKTTFRIREWMAAMVQRVAMERAVRGFRFLGYELTLLGRCPRWRTSDGEIIEYVRRPLLARADYILAAAGVPIELARQRLAEPDLQEFCPGVRVLNKGTQLCNLASSVGAAVHYRRNAPQILFAVAQVVVKLATEGKRVLVVVKKRFAGDTARILARYLSQLAGAKYRVLRNPKPAQLADPLVVPLINYGAQGVNVYQDFEAAIAVSSYNARLDILVERLNEIYPPEERVPMDFSMEAGQRVLHTQGYWQQRQGFEALARAFQHHLEAAWSEQALGRVRFAVRPRLVVFFQKTPMRYPIADEFHSLAAFRAHFGLLTRREWEVQRRREVVQRLLLEGKTCTEIAKAIGASRRTVYRLLAELRRAGCDTSP